MRFGAGDLGVRVNPIGQINNIPFNDFVIAGAFVSI